MRATTRGAHTYAKTLNLPRSSLANRPSKELVQQRIKDTSDKLYEWQINQQAPTRIFHDGPPYANGALHLGHAMNKILKDIINRSNVLQGFRVLYRPGWDCHGLPIENASRERARKKKQKLETAAEIREHARKLALEMVEKQRSSFRQFAIMADWENPYLTLSPDYVVRQLEVFAKMMSDGLVFRQRKPVYWSVESRTALAEGELQYEQQTSPAIYVKYPVYKDDTLVGSAVIWTTTPWTLPANRAIAVSQTAQYVFVEQPGSEPLIIAANLVDHLPFGAGNVIKTVSGVDLTGYTYKDPLTKETRPIIIAAHVTDQNGTGLVHTAPAHGKEDYLAGLENDLEVYCPVDGAGKYTDDLHSSYSALVGLDARKQGSTVIMEMLQSCNALLHTSKITHNVPFDWRSKTPVMIRSTPQFFVDLSDVRQRALEAIKNVSFSPETGRARLQAFIQSRTEWCVSRQRVWGVPIPVLFHKETDDALMDPPVVEHIIKTIKSYGDKGLEKWFESQETIAEWLPADYQQFASSHRKGTDTMDVWFDSGSSWTQFSNDQLPVSYYLEGSDQHRGWFQSSLLTRVAVESGASLNSGAVNPVSAPYQRLITHGMILDQHGQKMSKSLGNVTAPDDIINGNSKFKALGIDGLRLFIAQTDYTGDVVLSPIAVSQVASTIKKLRLTFKFLLGNLEGYEPSQNKEVVMSPADKYVLGGMHKFVQTIASAYEEQNFSLVVKTLNVNMNSLLSSFYFDVSKDVLYTEAAGSQRRQAIQSVLHQILRIYLSVLSPITPLLCQEVWEHSPDYITGGHATPLMARWPETSEHWVDTELESDFEIIKSLKSAINDTIELARGDKRVGSSLGCDVYIETPHELMLAKYQQYLSEFLIVSHVHFGTPTKVDWSYTKEVEGFRVTATSPTGHKCPRCWQYTAPVEEDLCVRCDEIVHNN